MGCAVPFHAAVHDVRRRVVVEEEERARMKKFRLDSSVVLQFLFLLLPVKLHSQIPAH